jgi:hypothetical protein
MPAQLRVLRKVLGLNVEPLGERRSHQKKEDMVANSYRCLSAIIVMNVTVWYVLRKPSSVRTSNWLAVTGF